MSMFFTSRKTALKLARHLLDTLLFVELFKIFLIAISIASRHLVDRESSRLFVSFSTTGGSIELLFLYLMVCSSTPPQYLYLSKTNFSIPSSIDVLTPLDTYICRDLRGVYLHFLIRSDPYFFRSLS